MLVVSHAMRRSPAWPWNSHTSRHMFVPGTRASAKDDAARTSACATPPILWLLIPQRYHWIHGIGFRAGIAHPRSPASKSTNTTEMNVTGSPGDTPARALPRRRVRAKAAARAHGELAKLDGR